MELVIGCDINEYYVQFSYAEEGKEPVMPDLPGVTQVETALCRREGVNQWYEGKEAVKRALAGEGALAEHLFSRMLHADTIRLSDSEYQLTDLCSLFLEHTYTAFIRKVGEQLGEEITVRALVLTGRIDPGVHYGKLQEIVKNLPVEDISFQSHEESIFSYLVHQPRRLMGYETQVLDLTSEQLVTYRVEMNHKTRPVVVSIETTETDLYKKKHYASIMEHDRELAKLDQELAEYMQDYTAGRIVTSLYLIGDGFHGDWYQETLKVICRNRKVFAGDNLFGKGACFAAAERIWKGEASEDFLYLGKDMLQYNVGIRLYDKTEEIYCPLLDAGTNWYEAVGSLAFYIEDTDEIRLQVVPIRGGKKEIVIGLDGLKRPYRSCLLELAFSMQDKETLELTVLDHGFGSFFAPVREPFTKAIRLAEQPDADEKENACYVCIGQRLQKPYQVAMHTDIFSMEELCYYITVHADMLDQGFMWEDLADAVEQMELFDLAGSLRQLLHFQGSLHTFCRMILEEAAYVSADKMTELMETLTKNETLTPLKRKQKQADGLYSQKAYMQAITLYRELLREETEQENKAVLLEQIGKCMAQLFEYGLAEAQFMESYRLGRKEALHLYLLCRRMQMTKEEFVRFITEHEAYYESALTVEQEYESALQTAEDTLKQMEGLPDMDSLRETYRVMMEQPESV